MLLEENGRSRGLHKRCWPAAARTQGHLPAKGRGSVCAAELIPALLSALGTELPWIWRHGACTESIAVEQWERCCRSLTVGRGAECGAWNALSILLFFSRYFLSSVTFCVWSYLLSDTPFPFLGVWTLLLNADVLQLQNLRLPHGRFIAAAS